MAALQRESPGSPWLRALLWILVSFQTAFPAGGRASDQPVDYSRDVLPVLADACYHCHGPDEKTRKAKLRLDTKEGAFRVQDGTAVIVPGKAANSELVRRITSTDPDDVMPPPDSNRKLSSEQIATLERWVAEGATWGRPWAFEPIRKPAPPATKLQSSARNDIDRFILARVESEGLIPSSEQSRDRLLRRVTLDLTGLPPTIEELDAFLKDSSPTAYESVVDRLLRSPRYGERMAVEWLDIARYADTHGYQMDRYRAVWPYRDWVIRAFNDNQPFDAFVTWQIAGDLMPNATRDQRLATAFNRLHLQNEEGGVVEEEFRVAYVVDRVNTFGTAFLGLTFDCSRCHDHKFDPITMKDFYSLFAFFQNIDESGQTVYFGEVMPVPTLLLPDAATESRLQTLEREIREREQGIPPLKENARAAFVSWLSNRPPAPPIPDPAATFNFDEFQDNQTANSVDPKAPGKVHDELKQTIGVSGQGVELNGENGLTFPGIGHFTRADSFSIALWVRATQSEPRQVILHHSRAPIDAGSRGYELLLEDSRPAVGLHHMWPGNSLKIRSRVAIPTNTWVHLAFTYDGSSRADGLVLYLNGRIVEREVIRDGLKKDITYAGGEPDLAIGYRFRDSGFKGGAVDDLHIFRRALTPIEMADVAGLDDFKDAWAASIDSLAPNAREALFDYYFTNVHPTERQFLSGLAHLRREQSRLIEPVPEIMVMEEMTAPRAAYILKRGAYHAHGEDVGPDTPSALPEFPADQPRNRLGLARWLTSPENPLLARVTVNRAWQMMFGSGLVETSDNFGAQGSPPSHPELLDWLAHDFMASGWNYKSLIKKIALSGTYRQSSDTPPEARSRDPQNHLLSRGPTRRLDAEMIRDQALAASGLLVERLGGPSVKPYQPEGLWEVAMGNPKYDQGKGEELYRRSLYTFWKRTVPPPAMTTFDASERNQCTARRQTTSTPLQALALLNDPQLVEAARHLGERMMKACPDSPERQVAWAFRQVTSRKPNTRELAILIRLYSEQRELFSADALAAARLLAVGETPNDPALDPVDLAAGAMTAAAILNHDDAILRR